MGSRPKRSLTRQTLDLLREYESRNVTYIDPAGGWPIVWERARGAWVWDAEGKRYLDLTAAFGVAAAGHANPSVVRAGRRQMGRLLHAMGDVHPHRLKAQLARELSRLTFERWSSDALTGKTIFCNSGFEAVEAALKTAMLATGKPGVVVFKNAYHGLGYGALNATHRPFFRSPFTRQLAEFGRFLSFPALEAEAVGGDSNTSQLKRCEVELRAAFARGKMGAVLVEPIQVRGGINLAPPGFLPLLRSVCDQHGALLILDEIYTGFGRTGRWFACEHSGTVPDLICLGKGLTGGFPLSACVGRAALMDAAWPPSSGEAIHTSTFLGNPVGCAMALAQIREIETRDLVQRSAALGPRLLAGLRSIAESKGPFRASARGQGLLAGLELWDERGAPATDLALGVIKRLLHEGYIFLPEGEHANVISLTPPLTLSARNLTSAVNALRDALLRP